MNIDIESNPQVEAFRLWWTKHGKKVSYLAVALAVLAGGWKYWDVQSKQRLEQASTYYEEMQNSLRRNNAENAQLQALQLMKQFSKTPYASAAALFLAKQSLQAKKYNEAKTHLEWVVDHTDHPAFEQLARTRLARIYLNEKDAEKALTVLKQKEVGPYTAVYIELRGDAYQLQGKPVEAKKAYQQAKGLYQEKEIARALLEMKLNELAQ